MGSIPTKVDVYGAIVGKELLVVLHLARGFSQDTMLVPKNLHLQSKPCRSCVKKLVSNFDWLDTFQRLNSCDISHFVAGWC